MLLSIEHYFNQIYIGLDGHSSLSSSLAAVRKVVGSTSTIDRVVFIKISFLTFIVQCDWSTDCSLTSSVVLDPSSWVKFQLELQRKHGRGLVDLPHQILIG